MTLRRSTRRFFIWCERRLSRYPLLNRHYRKVVYLTIMDTSKKWTMPIRNWKGVLNRFIIEFEDRLIDYDFMV